MPALSVTAPMSEATRMPSVIWRWLSVRSTSNCLASVASRSAWWRSIRALVRGVEDQDAGALELGELPAERGDPVGPPLRVATGVVSR